MFNIGPGEIIVLMALALLFFGPKKLPEIGRTVGHAMREFRKTSGEFMDAFHNLDSERSDYRPAVRNMEYPDYPSAAAPDGSDTYRDSSLDYGSENYEALPYGADFYPSEPETKSAGETVAEAGEPVVEPEDGVQSYVPAGTEPAPAPQWAAEGEPERKL